ncbi:MAG: FAD-dependent oxidoreductase [Desulfobacterales bacterium]|nr:FAD-dependent oxidoreductase [Desulfobacterales bacterium]
MNIPFQTKSKRSKPRILIVGGNFAGLETVIHLNPDHVDVMMIDPCPFFEFYPNINEIVSSVKKPYQLVLSKENILRRHGHKWFQDHVVNIDPKKKQIHTQNRLTLSYDICVLAIGSVVNTYHVDGVNSHAMFFKNTVDCYAICLKLNELLEHNSSASVVIVGSGMEGIEAMGEILRKYRDNKSVEVHMVEQADRVFPQGPDEIGKELKRLCIPYSVFWHTGKRVIAVEPNHVVLDSNQTLPSDLTLWSAGIQASNLIFDSGLSNTANGWARVSNTLQSMYHNDIFAIGNACELPNPVSKQAYHAMEMGECAANNIGLYLNDKELIDVKLSNKPKLLSFGDIDTFLIAGKTVIAGSMIAAAKESVYQYVMNHYDSEWAIAKWLHICQRAYRGAYQLGWQTFGSLEAIQRLPNIRFL